MESPEFNDLLQQFNSKRLNEEAFNIERVYFTKTSKRVNPRQEQPYEYFAGKRPILIVAPHAVRYQKRKKVCKSDEFTGSIAVLLHQLLDCHALAVTKLYGGDPDFDTDCIVRDEIETICKENSIKKVITLLAAPRDKSFVIEVSQATDDSRQKKWEEQLTNAFSAVGEIKSNKLLKDDRSLTSFAAEHLNCLSLELKINRKYRVPHQNGMTFNKLMAALVLGLSDGRK